MTGHAEEQPSWDHVYAVGMLEDQIAGQADTIDDYGNQITHMRALLGELGAYARLPLPSPAPGDWDEYQRTARTRLEHVGELCRAAAQSDTLPLSVEACIAVVKACNAAPLPYEPEPGLIQTETAAEIDARELSAATAARLLARSTARPLRIVAAELADALQPGELQPGERCPRAVHDSAAGWWCPCHGDWPDE